MSNQITLQVNGETHNCSSPIPLPDLLQQLGFNPRLVAVEYNGEILHRQLWNNTNVKQGDLIKVFVRHTDLTVQHNVLSLTCLPVIVKNRRTITMYPSGLL